MYSICPGVCMQLTRESKREKCSPLAHDVCLELPKYRTDLSYILYTSPKNVTQIRNKLVVVQMTPRKITECPILWIYNWPVNLFSFYWGMHKHRGSSLTACGSVSEPDDFISHDWEGQLSPHWRGEFPHWWKYALYHIDYRYKMSQTCTPLQNSNTRLSFCVKQLEDGGFSTIWYWSWLD